MKIKYTDQEVYEYNSNVMLSMGKKIHYNWFVPIILVNIYIYITVTYLILV